MMTFFNLKLTRQHRLTWAMILSSFLTAGYCPLTQASQKPQQVSHYLIGLNLSYFNDLDEVWQRFEIPEKLKNMGATVLRFPGGEETSRWHWDRPGINGYVDVWNPEHHNQNWQSTWISPDEWDTDTAFMSIDEYFAHCQSIGALPLLGINMTSGEAKGDRSAGIRMAVEMVEYVLDKGYPLTWMYLDNEPWNHHHSNYYIFEGDSYAQAIVEYVSAIKKIAPNTRFIANPFEQYQALKPSLVKKFLSIAGSSVDAISIHYYWEWGRSSWELWKSQTPMLNSSQWRAEEKAQSYTQDLKQVRKTITDFGYPEIHLAVLEWNADFPEKHAQSSPNQMALIQAEMLMQFIDAGVMMATIWPMFWQITPPGGVTGDVTGTVDGSSYSIFEHHPPYETTPTYEMFKLFRDIPGSKLAESFSDDNGIHWQKYETESGKTIWIVLNKSEAAYPLSMLSCDSILVEKYQLTTLNPKGTDHKIIMLRDRPTLAKDSIARIVLEN